MAARIRKPRLVRAILIDAFKQEVREVQHNANDYTDIYRLLSHPTMPVDCVTCITHELLPKREAIFVDDSGLLKPCHAFFRLPGYTQFIAGNGLILGMDRDGETEAAFSDVADIRGITYFLWKNPDHE